MLEPELPTLAPDSPAGALAGAKPPPDPAAGGALPLGEPPPPDGPPDDVPELEREEPEVPSDGLDLVTLGTGSEGTVTVGVGAGSLTGGAGIVTVTGAVGSVTDPRPDEALLATGSIASGMANPNATTAAPATHRSRPEPGDRR